MNISLSAFVPENLVSRDGFGSSVPRQPAHLQTQAESGAYLRDSSRVPRRRPFIHYNRHTPSGQSRVYRVTQFRTNGVHCQEPAGTGPVNLKVVPNECCLDTWQVTMDQLIFASLSHIESTGGISAVQSRRVVIGTTRKMFDFLISYFKWEENTFLTSKKILDVKNGRFRRQISLHIRHFFSFDFIS